MWLFEHAGIRALWRGAKTAFIVAVSAFLVELSGQPAWFGLAPLVMTLEKWIRDKIKEEKG